MSGAWGLVRRVGLSLMRLGLESAREEAVGTGMCEMLCWYCCGEKGNDWSRYRKQLKEKGEGEDARANRGSFDRFVGYFYFSARTAKGGVKTR